MDEAENTFEDPVLFFTYATSFPPYQYQADFLKMKDKRIAMNWGRQSGKSLVVAIRALWQAFTIANQVILILAPTLRQSNIIFRYVKFYAENKNLINKHIIRNTTTEMWFDNGSQIYCLPSGHQSGDNIRGYAAKLIIIDEAAYVEEDAFLAIEPSLAATDGGLILISTPRGRCFSDDTYIMTYNGWKKISQITKDDLIACLINNKVEYNPPQEIYKYENQEFLSFKSHRLSLDVTPDHNLFVKIQKGPWQKKEAKYFLNTKTEIYFKLDFPWQEEYEEAYITIPAYKWLRHKNGKVYEFYKKEKTFKMDNWLEFLGYYMSEGHLGNLSVEITQNRGPICDKIRKSIEKLGLKYKESEHGPNANRFVIHSIQLNNYLKPFKKEGFPIHLKNLSKRQIKILVDAIFDGDGDKFENRKIFTGIYEKYTDDVQELLLKLGHASRKMKDKNCWYVTITDGKSKIHKFSTIKNPIKYRERRGDAYCCTVKGGLVFVRKDGTCCWCGNTGFYYESFAPTSEYKTMHIKSEDCPGIKKEFLAKRRTQLTENEYKQEYEAEFTSEANTYFRLDQIKDAMIIEKEIEKAEEECKYDFGVDVARMGEDETVLIIVDKTNKKMVKIDAYSKKPTTEIIDMIKYWYDRFVPESINVDSASMGAGVCDILLKEQYPIKMIDLNRTSEKENIYENLKLLLERRLIKLLKNYKLEDQLKDIISTFTQMGRHISASSDRRHEDRVDALCLACANIKPVEDETEEFFGASG